MSALLNINNLGNYKTNTDKVNINLTLTEHNGWDKTSVDDPEHETDAVKQAYGQWDFVDKPISLITRVSS